MDRGAWWAAVHGVAKSRTQLSKFKFTFPFMHWEKECMKSTELNWTDKESFSFMEKETTTHSSVLAWRVPGTGQSGGLLSIGSHRVGHDWSNLAAAVATIKHIEIPGMGEFNSDDHYIYYCGQESLRRNGIAVTAKKKSLKCSTWMQSHKQQNDNCSFPRQTIQYHSNPSLCPNQ